MEFRHETRLKRLIAHWRREMADRTAFDEAALDELESHLWDEVERRVGAGVDLRDAVLQASARLGHPDVLAGEYRKVTEWSSSKRPRWQHPFWFLIMWKSYLTLALRNLRKQPVYSAINIGGLGIGLACVFMIVLFVRHEWSFDDFHENGDRLYRLVTHTVKGENTGDRQVIFPAAVDAQIEERIPEVEHAVLYDDRNPFLKVDNESRRVGTVGFMDEEAFSVFTFPLLRGEPETALRDRHSIVLSEKAAGVLFPDSDPMGRVLSYDGRFDLTVTGIMKDVPENSHILFEALAPITLMIDLMGEGAMENFSNVNYQLYVLLSPGTRPESVEEKLAAYRLELYEGDEEAASQQRVELQPITDIHLEPGLGWDNASTIDPRYLYMFIGIGVLMLFIAGANFTNLATARALQRAREVGVRKTAGARRSQIAVQFIGESVVLALVAVVVAMILMWFALPLFAQLVGTHIAFNMVDVGVAAFLVFIGLMVGILAGAYPAFFLSAFRPAVVLKGKGAGGSRGAVLRKGLIVVQFGISVFLMVCTFSVYHQLRYMQSQKLGFDTEQVVYALLTPPIQKNFDTFAQQVRTSSRVVSVTQAGNVPGRINTSRGYNWPGSEKGQSNSGGMYTVLADYDYIDTIGLHLIAGRDFDRDRPTDFEDAYILNETAGKEIGFPTPKDAVGAPFHAWDKETGEIIGVVEDFHFQSLHEAIEPVVINIKPWMSYAMFRVTPGDAQQVIADLQEAWTEFAPGLPFEYRWLDEDFDRLYNDEQELEDLFTFFAAIAIFVACLGLFGLAAYSAERRTKEIGIRKVMGADVRGIILLLSREFTVLVAVAFVIAAPLGWYAISQWSESFAYRANVSWMIYAGAGLGSLAIAWLTVGVQAFRAATVDPVQSLRYE